MDAARPASGPAKPAGVDELILPGINPSNIRTPGGRFRVEGVTNDMFNIANQLRELNPRLFVNLLEDRANNITFYAIMERQLNGDEALVMKVRKLDGRVIEYVRHILHVPFAERYAEAEKAVAKYEADERDAEMEDLVERIGLPMLRDLRELGFLGEYEHTDAGRSRKRHGAGAPR